MIPETCFPVVNGNEVGYVCQSCDLGQFQKTSVQTVELEQWLEGNYSLVIQAPGEGTDLMEFRPNLSLNHIPGYVGMTQKILSKIPMKIKAEVASWAWRNRRSLIFFATGPLIVMAIGSVMAAVVQIQKSGNDRPQQEEEELSGYDLAGGI